MLGKLRRSSTVVGRTGCTKRGSVRRSGFKEDTIWVKLDRDLDALLFSSISSFSDSSSGGFSSSDDESIFRSKSRSSCFAPPWSKVVHTSVSGRSVRTERKLREVHIFDDYQRRHNYVEIKGIEDLRQSKEGETAAFTERSGCKFPQFNLHHRADQEKQ